MRDPERDRSIGYVLVATLLFSFIGPVAKLVPQGAGAISFFRAAFALLALATWLAVRRGLARERRRLAALFAGTPAERARAVAVHAALGVFLAGNWYFYVLAVQVSSVALAVVCLFTYPLFTAVLEPVFFSEPFRAVDLLAGALVLAGVFVMVERVSGADATALGAFYGVLSALSFTLRNLLGRRAVREHAAETLTLVQFAVATCVFSPCLLVATALPAPRDLLLLAVLGSGLTLSSQLLFIASLKRLSTTVASLIVSLQPALAAAAAFVLLGEVPKSRTIAGGALVLAAVVLALAASARAARPSVSGR